LILAEAASVAKRGSRLVGALAKPKRRTDVGGGSVHPSTMKNIPENMYQIVKGLNLGVFDCETMPSISDFKSQISDMKYQISNRRSEI
jgi:hypothetical protein